MNKRITERIIVILLVLFLLVYVGYQAQRFFYSPISTDTVYEYKVSRSLEARGVAVRNEAPLDQDATGGEFYPVEDASRVAVGETVIEMNRSRNGESGTRRVKEIQQEIGFLQQAQNTAVDYANTEYLNRDIKAKLGSVSTMASMGRYEGIAEMRQNVTLNINKKQVSNGMPVDFSTRIAALQSELQGLQGAMTSGAGVLVKAPVSGYFSRMVDGYETQARPEMLENMGVADYARLIAGETPPVQTQKAGKMVYSEKWTFAAVIPAYHTEWINELMKAESDRMQKLSVELQFDQVAYPVSATISEVIEEKNADLAVLLFSCNRMNEELINLRTSGVVVAFQQYTGIRINSADVRFRPNEEGVNEQGVYVLDDHVVRFKLLDPIYKEAGFVLSKTYYVDTPMDKNYVRLFDQVITKGTDLYDGKTIHKY